MSVESPNDWWGLCDEYRDQLVELIAEFHPLVVPPYIDDMPITSPVAEQFRQFELQQIKASADRSSSPVDLFNSAVDARDHESTINLLQATWWGVPESTACWNYSAFGALCDLCSECWVFEQLDKDA